MSADGNIPLHLRGDVQLDTNSIEKSAETYGDRFQKVFNKALTKLDLSKSQIIPKEQAYKKLSKAMDDIGRGGAFGNLAVDASNLSNKIVFLGKQLENVLGKTSDNEVNINTEVAEAKMEELLKTIVKYNEAVENLKPIVAEELTKSVPSAPESRPSGIEARMKARIRADRAKYAEQEVTTQPTEQFDATTESAQKATEAVETFEEAVTSAFNNPVPTGTWQADLSELPRVALSAVSGLASGFKQGISETFSNEVAPVLREKFIYPITDNIKNARDTVVSAASGLASGFAQGIKEGLDETVIPEKVAAIKAKFSELKETFTESDFYQFHADRARAALSSITGVIDSVKNKFGEINASELMGNISNGVQSVTSKIGSAMSSVGSVIKGVFTNSFAGIIPNLEAMANGVGKVTSKLGQLASISFAGLKKGLGSIISKFRQMGKSAGQSVESVSKKMKRMTLSMIKAGLGVRGLYMLFRKLRQAIKEGMEALAQQVPEFNDVFSEFKTALNGIKGSVATAFQPILQVVLPILTQLANALSNVMNIIAKFNAVLVGQSYIYKFTAAQQDYAKSLNGTGSAAKKATKDLMGFDEINRLSDKDSGGGGGNDGLGTFTQEPIQEDAVSDFAEMVKKAWETADFTEVGKKIGTSIKDGMESATEFFDTEGQKWAEHLSKSLSTFINGMVDVDGLGYSIGESLGAGLNVGITFLRDFWRDTDFEGIGSQLGESINGLFDKVDWDGLGEYFGFRFNGIFNFIGGLADSTEWDNVGTNLATGLNKAVETMDVGQATANVSKLLIGILDSGIAFLTTTDFENIGKKLADGLAGIDFKNLLGKAGTLISKGAQGILDMFIGFCKNTDWEQLTTDILDGLGSMFENIWDDGQLLQKLADGFVQLFVGAFKILWNVGKWLHENLVQPMIDKLVSLFEEQDTGDLGKNIIMGILNGIGDALYNIGKWIYENIFLPIYNGIKECFGINSPATTMIDIGLDLIAGLFDGLKGIWNAISGIFDSLKKSIIGVFESIGKGIATVWETIKSGISTAWNAIKTTIVNLVSSIMNVVLKQFDNIKNGVINAFKFIRDTGETIWNGLWNIIKSVINTIIGGINGMINAVESGINFVIRALNKLSWTVPDWVPKIGGSTFGFDIPEVSFPNIPLLAEGAVLPPNQPFMAMVGDQKSGTNVEAPLETIKQAVAEVIMENNDILTMGFEAVVQAIQNKDMSVRIGDRDIYEANNNYSRRLDIMRGTV